jgi:hypothetical protein
LSYTRNWVTGRSGGGWPAMLGQKALARSLVLPGKRHIANHPHGDWIAAQDTKPNHLPVSHQGVPDLGPELARGEQRIDADTRMASSPFLEPRRDRPL